MGPFLSDCKNNDISILKPCVYNNEQQILNWLEGDDILILDLGFRDAIRPIEQFKFQVAMLPFPEWTKTVFARRRPITTAALLKSDGSLRVVRFAFSG